MTIQSEPPPAPYGKVHTDGSRSGGMPPGTNAQSAAPQDDLVDAWRAARDAWRSGPGCQFTDEGHLRLGDELAAVAVLAAFIAPVIAERDALLAENSALKETIAEISEFRASMEEELTELLAKLAAADAALRKYGRHLDGCDLGERLPKPPRNCSCGFHAALAPEAVGQ